MSNTEVAVPETPGAELAETLSPEELALANELKGNVDRDDLVLAALNLTQGQSQAVEDGLAEKGQWFNTLTSEPVGDTVDVIISGVYPVIAAGSVTANNLITSGGTDGTAIAESAGSGVLVGVLGPALEDGVSGDRVATVINPFIKQGA